MKTTINKFIKATNNKLIKEITASISLCLFSMTMAAYEYETSCGQTNSTSPNTERALMLIGGSVDLYTWDTFSGGQWQQWYTTGVYKEFNCNKGC